MTQENVTLVLNKYKKLVPKESSDILKSQLTNSPDEKFDTVMALPMRSRWVIVLISVFLGLFGVDRFYLKHTSLGCLKLGFGILATLFMVLTSFSTESVIIAIVYVCWWLSDIHYSIRAVQEYNLGTISNALK